VPVPFVKATCNAPKAPPWHTTWFAGCWVKVGAGVVTMAAGVLFTSQFAPLCVTRQR
jgi:hypothetical protein